MSRSRFTVLFCVIAVFLAIVGAISALPASAQQDPDNRACLLWPISSGSIMLEPNMKAVSVGIFNPNEMQPLVASDLVFANGYWWYEIEGGVGYVWTEQMSVYAPVCPDAETIRQRYTRYTLWWTELSPDFYTGRTSRTPCRIHPNGVILASELRLGDTFVTAYYEEGWWDNWLDYYRQPPFSHAEGTTYYTETATCSLFQNITGAIYLSISFIGYEPGDEYNFSAGALALIWEPQQ